MIVVLTWARGGDVGLEDDMIGEEGVGHRGNKLVGGLVETRLDQHFYSSRTQLVLYGLNFTSKCTGTTGNHISLFTGPSVCVVSGTGTAGGQGGSI